MTITSPDLEAVVRPLLRAFQEATGLDTTYLTEIDWETGTQHIRFARHMDGIEIPEGLEVDWTDTLCRRALESGQSVVLDVPDRWGDSDAARELGILTYVSAPVRTPDGAVWGTLCGVSGDVREVNHHARQLLELFSGLIADRVDVEQRRQAAEVRADAAEELLRERAVIVAELEHKLKTPLTTAGGWIKLLKARAQLDEQAAEWVDRADRSCTELHHRVERLLHEARSEVLRHQLEPAPLALDQHVEHVLGQLLIQDRSIEANISPVYALSHPQVLRDVVEHLVENATKYSPVGSTIRVTVCDGTAPALIVEDEGPGLPDGVDVFAPFVRGDTTVAGIGLGLHIVRSLVEACGGSVHAGTAAAGGARFTVRWKRASPPSQDDDQTGVGEQVRKASSPAQLSMERARNGRSYRLLTNGADTRSKSSRQRASSRAGRGDTTWGSPHWWSTTTWPSATWSPSF